MIVWLGITDESSEGLWVSSSTGYLNISFIKKYLKLFIYKNTFREELSFPGYWEAGRPLESDRENCARKLQILNITKDFKQNYRF